MSNNKHTDYTLQKKNVENVTFKEQMIVKMYMKTRRARPMYYKDKHGPKDAAPERYLPQFTDYGMPFYELPVKAFIKFKSGEWDKYHLGSNVFVEINMPTRSGGFEARKVYPVVEQVVKQGTQEPAAIRDRIQGLPLLIPVYDNSKDSILKDVFLKDTTKEKV